MIFRYNFVHCDAHPGNILVRRKPPVKSKNPNPNHIHVNTQP